jgi:large subunit ribosomal protein L23
MKTHKELTPNETVLYPLISEKAVNMIESENKIVFIVNKMANKPAIKKAVETLYSVKVSRINVLNDRKGRKSAIIRLNKAFKADDLATKLGVI